MRKLAIKFAPALTAASIAIGAGIGMSGAQAQLGPAVAQKAGDSSSIAAAIQSQGYARVIVEFSGPAAANQLRPDPALLADARTQIAAAQNAIIAAHFDSVANPRPGQGFARGLTRFEIRPLIAVNVTQAELNALAADSRITHIQLDALDKPNLLQSLSLIGMPSAYSAGATGAGQAVAIIDTGVQSNHEFLSGKVVMEACFSNGAGGGTGVTLCPNGLTSQSGSGAANSTTAQCINGGTNLCVHGTHVAGIAAGSNTSQSTGEPTNGVAKSAKIVGIQVFTRFNDTTSCGGTAPCVLAYNSDQILALDWIFQNALTPASGVSLASVNMSLGGGKNTSTCDSDSRKGSIDNLLNAGVATAIASGNNGYTDGVSTPGCISTAVTVGSTDKSDVISWFSNMSAVVDLMAPGGSALGGSCVLGASNQDILSSVAGTSSGQTNAYDCLAGTSMATPHVAGAFAAIRSVCTTKTIAQILAALQSTGLSISDTRSGGTVTKKRIKVDLALQQLGCTSSTGQIAHDFNGDGKSDILWRSTAGDVSMWFMNGTSLQSGAGVSVINTGWQIARAPTGSGDFNGDGKADILWRHTNGALAMWLMNGSSISTGTGLGSVDTAWQIAGIGDFNGDGKADILWRSTGGTLAIWFMNGTSISSSAGVATIATSWQVAAVTDLDGDGKADIVLRNSTTGDVAVWLMNGATIASSAGLGVLPVAWQIVGAGDFNGDGKGDILWRHTSGALSMWFMNGTTLSSSASVGSISTAWSVTSTGDYDGNGKADILWRSTGGDIAVWLMNGASVSSSAGLGVISTAWTVTE